MPMFKRSMGVLLSIVLLVAAGMIYGIHMEEQTLPLDAAEQPAKGQSQLTVYVSGAVVHPGVIALPDGSRVADAVNACGGVLPTADMDALNMAQSLQDGVQIRVVEKVGQSATAASAAVQDGKVNINTADEKALDALPGIGPTMAQRIVEYRKQNGPFQQVEDLKKVKGIGAAKFAKLKEKVSL